MKKFNVKMITVFMVVVALICLVSNVNYATGDVNELIHDIREVPQEQNNTVERPAEVPTTQNTATNIATNTVLPKTGVDDTAMWVLIAVSAVAAIYTYKKVRDYNA